MASGRPIGALDLVSGQGSWEHFVYPARRAAESSVPTANSAKLIKNKNARVKEEEFFLGNSSSVLLKLLCVRVCLFESTCVWTVCVSVYVNGVYLWVSSSGITVTRLG